MEDLEEERKLSICENIRRILLEAPHAEYQPEHSPAMMERWRKDDEEEKEKWRKEEEQEKAEAAKKREEKDTWWGKLSKSLF